MHLARPIRNDWEIFVVIYFSLWIFWFSSFFKIKLRHSKATMISWYEAICQWRPQHWLKKYETTKLQRRICIDMSLSTPTLAKKSLISLVPLKIWWDLNSLNFNMKFEYHLLCGPTNGFWRVAHLHLTPWERQLEHP